jgi:hypothetical protein
MKQQPNIAEAQRWADEHAAKKCKSFTKRGSVGAQAIAIIELSNLMVDTRPDLVTKVVGPWEKRGEPPNNFGVLAIAARMVERGEQLPESLRLYIARVLRKVIRDAQRGTLMFRNGEIAWMLVELEKRGVPLFPNRDVGPRPGRTYGCDIVIKALEKSGIHVSQHLVEGAWRDWSRIFPRT